MGIRNRKSARIVGMVVVPIALTTFYTNLAIFSQFQRNITLMIRMEQPRQSATKVSHIDGYGNVVTEEKGDSVKNTNWDNVQYNSGVFSSGTRPQWQQEISDQCDKSVSIYKNENFDSVCSGPLATNTTCCYCYSEYPRFVLVDSVEKWHNHVLPLKEQDRNSQPDAYENNYWFCAEERENGLARNWTHVDAPAFQSSSSNQSRVALVTGKFSHNNSFQTEVNAHCRRVLATGFFSQDGWDLFCYGESPDFVVQNPRFQRHMRYRTDPDDLSAKGGGYWFHKSVLLRHHMNQYGDGDYLIWTDIDRLDFVRQGSFNAILETMATRKDDLLIESMAWSSEHIFTKGDMLAAFNASETLRQSLQVNANAIVFRVSPGMKRFINAWIECVSDWHMVSDEQSVIPNSPDYHDHRHDQSILGLLIKKFMTRQSAVGPPARTYHQRSHYHTFKLLDNVYPLCPFTSFYSAAYVANIGTKSKKGQ